MQRKAKIAIIHDAFLYRGGGERLVTEMAKVLDADLISGFFSEGSFDPRKLGFRGKMISLGKPVFMKGLRHLVLKWRFAQGAHLLSRYDIVIFSGDCLGALRHMHPEARAIYYCHTPPRYLYDFREAYLTSQPWWIRPFFRLAFTFFARTYEKRLSFFDQIFSNSKNVHDRLLDYTGYESEILYPPTDVDKFKMKNSKGKIIVPKNLESGILNLESQSYFLSFARLSPPKRVDMIVDAFLEMPDRTLVFTYGANDPLKETLLEKIENCPNIIAIESPDDEELISLIEGAITTIYIPIDEDFGMSPVESMACGIPVIGVDEGGLRETIQDEKTGKLIHIASYERGILALREAVEWMVPRAPRMKTACIRRAKDFSLEKFVEKLEGELRK